MKDVRVLLVFCNWESPSTPAIGITSIATHLIAKGYKVKIFDEAPYLIDGLEEDPREKNLSVIKSNKDKLYTLPKENRISDFKKLLKSYHPNIVGVSTARYGFKNGVEYLNIVRDILPNSVTAIGGPLSMLAPELVSKYNCIDIISISDGEHMMEELCDRISKGKDISNIEGTYKNPPTKLFDINTLAPLRYDLFNIKRLNSPLGGRVYRILPVEAARGCPHHCTNCSVPTFNENHKEIGNWCRIKKIENIDKDICTYISLYDPEYIYIMSCTFLAFSKKYTDDFLNMYNKYKIPFYAHTRPENIDKKLLQKFIDVGLNRLGVGVECGNENYRKKMLRREYSNKTLIKAFDILGELDIDISANVMVGLPDETKEMVFETIELMKLLKKPNVNITVSIYQAYEGTPLHKYCVDKGYYEKDYIGDTNVYKPNIKSKYMTDDEILDLSRKFNLYVMLDKTLWKDIDKFDIENKKAEDVFPIPFSHR